MYYRQPYGKKQKFRNEEWFVSNKDYDASFSCMRFSWRRRDLFRDRFTFLRAALLDVV